MAKHVKIAGRSFSIPEGTDLGEKNTSSNAGTGAGLALPKAGSNLPFKSLVAGANITFDIGPNTITINGAAGGDGEVTGEANTASNIGGGYGWFAQKSGVDLQFKSIVAGTNVTLSQDASTITVGVPNIGEANTSSNVGGAVGLAKAKVGVNLPFKTLVPGRHITLTSMTDTVMIASTDTGEANTASNLGVTGEGVFAQKSGVDLQFKKLKAGSNVSITSNSESVTISSTDTGEANTASNQGSGEGLVMAKSGVDLPFKTIKAGTNITLSSTANELTINSSGGSSGPAPFRNKIVNGDFSAFRNTAYQGAAASGKITARWELARSITAGAAHLEESGGVIFGKPRFDVGTMLTIYNDTTYSPVVADAYAVVRTSVDAVGVTELFDTPITLSFYIMSNKVGTYCVSLTTNPNQLRYVAEVTVNTADTWEYKTITIPAGIPYSGNESCFDYPNTQPWLFVNFALYAGANFQTATANTWTTGETGYLATANQVNFADSLDNYLLIAAVQLEKGNATLFDNTSQTLMVETCARTYNQWSANAPNYIYPFSGRATSATSVDIAVTLPSPQLVDDPTYLKCEAEGLVLTNGTSDYTISSIAVNKMFSNYVTLTVTSSGMTVGDTITFKSANYACNLRVYATKW